MPITVFIIDDSAVVRKVLTDLLSNVAGIEIIGSAQDPLFALPKMEKKWPQVIILDVEMPRMDGITFLKKIMLEHPTPVVMCSTLTEAGSKTSIKALSLGAIDVVSKPKITLKTSLSEASHDLISAIRTAAKANMDGAKHKPVAPIIAVKTKFTADVILSKGNCRSLTNSKPLIVIGASTGGTQAIETVLKVLPTTTLPILIVQHMPENFTKAFANRLNELCHIEVKEAEDGDRLLPGRALVAPGGKHMLLRTTQLSDTVQIKDGPSVSRHKPSVDVLFRSASKVSGARTLGIILTGMGDDGAKGLKELHDTGAKTIAQNQATCVVYGMPLESVKLGAVDYELPLNKIPEMIAAHK